MQNANHSTLFQKFSESNRTIVPSDRIANFFMRFFPKRIIDIPRKMIHHRAIQLGASDECIKRPQMTHEMKIIQDAIPQCIFIIILFANLHKPVRKCIVRGFFHNRKKLQIRDRRFLIRFDVCIDSRCDFCMHNFRVQVVG